MNETGDPVRWSARSGEAGTVVLRADMDAGWHIYAVRPAPPPVGGDPMSMGGGPLPTRVTVDGSPAAVAEPEPHAAFDPGFDRTVLTHDGSVELVVATDAPALSVTYQACNGATCLPPKTVIVRGETC